MKIFKFQQIYLLLAIIGFFSASLPTFVLAQEPTQTPAPVTGIFITVITTEPQINVRMGPSSTVYPVVGILLQGATAPALGRSQGGDWIQIEFPSAPNGVGWVYSPLVQISPPSNLLVVPPPPTPLPPATNTIDPTLAAQFVVLPTSTRLATFTPQVTYTPLPTFASAQQNSNNNVPLGTIVVAFAILGFIGFLLSLIRR